MARESAAFWDEEEREKKKLIGIPLSTLCLRIYEKERLRDHRITEVLWEGNWEIGADANRLTIFDKYDNFFFLSFMHACVKHDFKTHLLLNRRIIIIVKDKKKKDVLEENFNQSSCLLVDNQSTEKDFT